LLGVDIRLEDLDQVTAKLDGEVIESSENPESIVQSPVIDLIST
jgi:hypothetical protein